MIQPVSGSSPVDRNTIARQTVERVNEALQSGKSAGIAEIIQLVHALSANALDISVQELAELIEKDVAVTAKVLSAANTLGYNAAATQVTTIAEAIHTIGFNKVRMLAMSLMLMETAERTQDAAERRETSMLAVTSGMVAQAWAEQSGRRNADQIFVCASLRNFGRLVMTTFLVEDYRRAQQVAENLGDGDAAFRSIFGLTPLELGYELLKSANLPAPLLTSLRAFSPKMLEAAVLDPQTELLVAAEFSVRLCELSMNGDVDPEKFKRDSEALCVRFHKHLGITKENVGEFMERTQTKLSSFGHAFGMPELGREVGQRFQLRLDGHALPPRVRPAVVPAAPPPAPAKSDQPAKADLPGEGAKPAGNPAASLPAETGAKAAGDIGTHKRGLDELMQEAITRIGEMLARPDLRLEDAVRVLVESLRIGWEADEAIVLFERANGSFAVAGGSGERWLSAKLKMNFKREERNVLGVAVTRGEPVLIHDATDPKITAYLPPWFRANLALCSCAIVPGGDEKSSNSVAFVGWRAKQKLHLATADARAIRAALGLLITARRLSGG